MIINKLINARGELADDPEEMRRRGAIAQEHLNFDLCSSFDHGGANRSQRPAPPCSPASACGSAALACGSAGERAPPRRSASMRSLPIRPRRLVPSSSPPVLRAFGGEDLGLLLVRPGCLRAELVPACQAAHCSATAARVHHIHTAPAAPSSSPPCSCLGRVLQW